MNDLARNTRRRAIVEAITSTSHGCIALSELTAGQRAMVPELECRGELIAEAGTIRLRYPENAVLELIDSTNNGKLLIDRVPRGLCAVARKMLRERELYPATVLRCSDSIQRPETWALFHKKQEA